MKEYEEETKARWSHTKAYRQSKQKKYRPEELKEIMAMQSQIYTELYSLSHVPVSEEQVQKKVHEARMLIHTYWYDCDVEMFGHLGVLYESDDRFRETIDAHGAGLTDFLCAAIVYYVGKNR